MSQPNRAIETDSATNATNGATASMLTTSASWIDLLAASVPTPVPACGGAAVPVPAGWDAQPCAHLLFGPPYDELASEARGRGWIVQQLPGRHLH
jgi:hypothetical protein